MAGSSQNGAKTLLWALLLYWYPWHGIYVIFESISRRMECLSMFSKGTGVTPQHSSENISRFQSSLNSFLGQKLCMSPNRNRMIFHSNLAAVRFKQKTGRKKGKDMFPSSWQFWTLWYHREMWRERILDEYYNIYS